AKAGAPAVSTSTRGAARTAEVAQPVRLNIRESLQIGAQTYRPVGHLTSLVGLSTLDRGGIWRRGNSQAPPATRTAHGAIRSSHRSEERRVGKEGRSRSDKRHSSNDS